MDEKSRSRTVHAPQPAIPGPLPANRVVSVQAGDDEEVEWTWSTLPGGLQYVSGYCLRKKVP